MFVEYEKNRLVRRGVERELEIIGEAMKRILEIIPEIEISDSRRIINFRNRISHGYDTIDNSIVWGMVINHLPLLKSEIEIILAKDSPG